MSPWKSWRVLHNQRTRAENKTLHSTSSIACPDIFSSQEHRHRAAFRDRSEEVMSEGPSKPSMIASTKSTDAVFKDWNRARHRCWTSSNRTQKMQLSARPNTKAWYKSSGGVTSQVDSLKSSRKGGGGPSWRSGWTRTAIHRVKGEVQGSAPFSRMYSRRVASSKALMSLTLSAKSHRGALLSESNWWACCF